MNTQGLIGLVNDQIDNAIRINKSPHADALGFDNKSGEIAVGLQRILDNLSYHTLIPIMRDKHYKRNLFIYAIRELFSKPHEL